MCMCWVDRGTTPTSQFRNMSTSCFSYLLDACYDWVLSVSKRLATWFPSFIVSYSTRAQALRPWRWHDCGRRVRPELDGVFNTKIEWDVSPIQIHHHHITTIFCRICLGTTWYTFIFHWILGASTPLLWSNSPIRSSWGEVMWHQHAPNDAYMHIQNKWICFYV